MTGVGLALAAPGAIAWLSRPSGRPLTLLASAPWFGIFCMLLAGVVAIALAGERLRPDEIGFGRSSWRSVPLATALALFLVFVFCPLANTLLTQAGLGSFDGGRGLIAGLPAWYITIVVIVVAAGEEWLYRGYAIERLASLTGSAYAAGAISLLMFGIVHVPLWGPGVAFSALASGAIFTALYIWRRDIVALAAAHVLVDLNGLVFVPRGGHFPSYTAN